MKHSINRTITFTVAATTIFAMLIVITINIITTYRLTVDLSSITLSNQNEDISKVVEAWYDSIYSDLQNLANDIVLHESGAGIQQQVNRAFYKSPQSIYMLNMYYGSSDDDCIYAEGGKPPEGFRPTQRAWYQIASENPGELVVTAPYIDALTQNICITFARSVGYGKSLRGVVGMDFVMESLNKYITYVSKGSVNIIVFNSNGSLVFRPSADKYSDTAGPGDFGSEINGRYRGLWEAARLSSGKMFEAPVDGVNSFCSARKLGNGWYVVNFDSRLNVLAPLNSAVLSFITIAIIGVLIAVVVMYLVIRSVIFDPLKKLNAAAQEFDLEENASFAHIDIKTGKELKTLADALKQMESRTIAASKRAYTDYMTGLHTREYLFNKVTNDLTTKRHGPLYGFFVIDLDKFKYVNDTYGHSTGDSVIIECGLKLKEIFIEHGCVVARIGGDEFAVFMGIVSGVSDIETKCRMIKDEFARVTYGDSRAGMTGSVGVAVVDNDITYNEAFEYADKALYKIKENGRNGAEIVNLSRNGRSDGQ